ncbi:hypothetical protein SK128_024334 [Halocaridina rubra]|uniref:Uncharacterized protein n=1 Tax=Halocaridina rubra TaxID=373956 RepID=A0AAN8ZP39_HALRR
MVGLPMQSHQQDDAVSFAIHMPWAIPFAFQSQVKEELDLMHHTVYQVFNLHGCPTQLLANGVALEGPEPHHRHHTIWQVQALQRTHGLCSHWRWFLSLR